jgi:hypothetical protein
MYLYIIGVSELVQTVPAGGKVGNACDHTLVYALGSMRTKGRPGTADRRQ